MERTGWNYRIDRVVKMTQEIIAKEFNPGFVCIWFIEVFMEIENV